MSNGSPFGFSYSLDPAGRTSGKVGGGDIATEDLFAIAALSEYHLGGGAMLARNPLNGRQMVLAAEVLNALSHCSGFRAMDEHVSDLMDGASGQPERARAIRAILQSVRDGGLTLSAVERCRELAPRPAAAVPAPPVGVIITCDRPAALERLLASILAGCDLERARRLCVVDDSRVEAHRRRNRELLESFAARAACPAVYFGPDEARGLLAELLRRLPAQEASIRFLLDAERWSEFVSTGVSRNLAQLLSAGHPQIVFDDDAVCRLYRPTFAQPGFELSTGRRQALFFDELSAQEDCRLDGGDDALQQLGSCLGLALPEALAAMGAERLEPSAWRHAEAAFAAALRTDSRVLITECGTLGDPGTQDYSWVALMPAESVRRIARDPGQSALALRQAQCWLGVDRPTFAPGANFSQITGFDNRDFLPPYFPFGRGQDRLFGDTVRFLFPGHLALVHPWAVLHLRVQEAAAPASRPRGRVGPGDFPGYLTFGPLAQGGSCHAAEARERLDALAAAFSDLGSAPAQALSRLYLENRLRELAGHMETLRRNLAASDGGEPTWQDGLRKTLQEYRADMEREPDLTGRQETIPLWRSAWTGFGQALRDWPLIRENAKEILADQ